MTGVRSSFDIDTQSRKSTRICVVGTGPSSLAAVHGIISARTTSTDLIEVTVIASTDKSRFTKTSRPNALKSRFGNESFYKQGADFTGISEAFGGFSTIWGAGIQLWEKSEFEYYGLTKIDVCNALESLGSLMPLKSAIVSFSSDTQSSIVDFDEQSKNSFEFFEVVDSMLAIYEEGKNACRRCGQCLTGCPYGSIWSSEEFFNDLYHSSKVKFIKDRVSRVKPVSEIVNIELESGALLNFDIVILACGALASSKILVESQLVDEISLCDSQSFYSLFFSLRKTFSQSFALSDRWIRSKNHNVVLSLYKSNRETLNRLRNRLGFLRFFLPTKFLNNHFLYGIGSVDSDFSGRLKVKRSETGIEISREANTGSRKVIKKFKSTLLSFYRANLIIPIPIDDVVPVGYGFHTGGNDFLSKSFGMQNFSIKTKGKVFLADASQLSHLPPGPHTLSNMVVTHASVLRSFN